MIMAFRGDMARVAIVVAMALAASWKPLTKSYIKAAPMIKIRRS